MYAKIKDFNKNMNTICYSLCSMAERQDERNMMALGATKPDIFQIELIKKVYGS